MKTILTQEDLKSLLGNASFMTKEQWEELRTYDGTKRLKQRLGLGFFKRVCTITLEDFAQVLNEIGVASSLEEGKKIIPLFNNELLDYESNAGIWSGLRFSEVENIKGEKCYRVSIQEYCGFPY